MFYDFTNHICIMLVSRQPLYGNNLVNYGNQENIQSKPGKQEVKLATCRLCNLCWSSCSLHLNGRSVMLGLT